jgi:integrase
MKKTQKPTIKDDGFEISNGFRIRLQDTKAGKRYQVDLGRRSGKHVRKNFSALQEARNWAHKKSIEAENKGIAALQFSDEQKSDSVEAMALLKGFGINLRQAAAFYVKHNQKVDATNGTGALIEQYLAAQKEKMNKGALRPSSYRTAEVRLNKFADSLGHLAASAIEPGDIDSWLDANSILGTNRKNYLLYISGFFNWAIRQNKTQTNPAKETEAVKIATHTPEIHTPKEVTALLAEAEARYPDFIPYLAIAFFGGVRPQEITRLEWQDIDLTLGEIHIKAEYSKTNSARIVHLSGNLSAWLFKYQKPEGLVFPYSDSTRTRWRSEVYEQAKVRSISDGARHTFATFYLALNSLDDTLQELGHTDPKMLFRHYRGLAKNRKAQATKFFNIMPAEAKKAIPITEEVA